MTWPTLAEAMALPVQTDTRPERPRRPANVTDCARCGVELILGQPHEAPVLCTDCERT